VVQEVVHLINPLAQLLIEMVGQEVEKVMFTLIELEQETLLQLVHHKEILVELQAHLMVLVEVVEQQHPDLMDLVVAVDLVELVHLI
jgi:hypothetical protein